MTMSFSGSRKKNAKWKMRAYEPDEAILWLKSERRQD